MLRDLLSALAFGLVLLGISGAGYYVGYREGFASRPLLVTVKDGGPCLRIHLDSPEALTAKVGACCHCRALPGNPAACEECKAHGTCPCAKKCGKAPCDCKPKCDCCDCKPETGGGR